MLSPAVAPYSPQGQASPPPDGVTVLGTQFASVKQLFAPLSDRTQLTFIHVNDWLNELRGKLDPDAFTPVEPMPGMDWRNWRFPPGWANRLAPWIMPAIAARVRASWRKRRWQDPRLIVTFPYFLPLVKILGPQRAVYYAVDNYQAYWPDRTARLVQQENELIETAAATMAASAQLAQWYRQRVPAAADKVHHLPNGASPLMIRSRDAAMHGPAPLDRDLARHFAGSSGPVIGSYCQIDDGHGIEWLAALAARLPSCRFLFMGNVVRGGSKSYMKALADLEAAENVVFTGKLNEPDSRHVLWQCDVMIITDPINEQNLYSCPNRIATYLASGRPIVSTPIPEVATLGDLVYFATTEDAFADAVRRAARERDPHRIARRLARAEDFTWPMLAARVWSVLCRPSS